MKAPPPPPSLPTTYSAGSTGFDISKYQCGDIPATRSAVAVVQVTGGGIKKPPNPCYAQEAAWAGPNLSAYIYMDGLTAPDPVESRVEASKCNPKYPLCQDYDYGYFWASHWLSYSHQLGIHPKLWWLDVENGPSWTNPIKSADTIRGAADALRSQGVVVGIYSTPAQWATIAGSLTLPGVQVWTAGAGRLTGPGHTATQICKSGGYNFAGGHLKMVQYGYTGSFLGAYPNVAPYDYDYVCN
ncbi:MAG: hypothetical protein J2P57_21260 [Acidimicrobiaceae bacterium]|nr:hypothetical protein [Acidimicrobiaceae bacterium]